MQTYEPVGKCVYCGKKKNLSDEHIIPFCLNGKLILPKASCPVCADITSAFEGKVAQMLASFRQTENIKTRRPKKRKKTVLLKGDDNLPLEMPNPYMWSQLPTFQFELPGIYSPNSDNSKQWENAIFGIITKQPSIEKMAHWGKFKTKNFTYQTPKFDINNYTLLLAKIGHCLCVSKYGVDNFDHFLPPFILGEQNILATKSLDITNAFKSFFRRILFQQSIISLNLSYFVGSFKEILPPNALEHEYSFNFQESDIPKIDYLLYTEIRLFPFAGGPTAIVVVGKASKDQYKKCIDYSNKV